MTIATLLLTCLIFVLVGLTSIPAMLTSLSVAAVVCIASSNGGTTSQDLKTGYLVGATPKYQQLAILIGALTSAVVIGGTMLILNAGGTHYTKKGFPSLTVTVPADAERQKVGQPYAQEDAQEYRVFYLREQEYPQGAEGWYLVDDKGDLVYKMDVPINRKEAKMDDGQPAPDKFKAPQPQLFALIIEGILGGKLQWGLVIAGVFIALVIELMGLPALPVAVGMYLGLGTAVPIFFGGLLRWATDRWRGVSASEAETETSPGVLMSSGYIAGGTLCGLLIGFLVMLLPKAFMGALDLGPFMDRVIPEYTAEDAVPAKIVGVVMFLVLAVILLFIGLRKDPRPEQTQPGEAPGR
jgi:uncharacterized oligopeptide transporter (OPT) family protein